MKKIEKGITLVALVITIVILLILAGIAIAALTGDNGLFSRAQQAKEETIKSQLKEEITMSIQEIQTEELPKGNNVTLETLADGQLESKLKDITVALENDEINGEYKDYEYTIDSNLNVTINGAATGVRIKGNAEVQSGYVFEGNTVDIKVTASITEGTITGIEAPEGATIKTDTSATEKVYTVSKSGKYIFKTISEVKKDSFKINVESNYPEGAITEYKYSVGGTVKQQGTTDKNYTVTGLTPKTKYSNIKVTAYINNESKDSNVEEITTKDDSIEYSWSEIAEIAKAISNNTSITDDTETATVTVNGVQKTLNVGDTATLEGKKVRILGFNHDELADSEKTTAYNSATETGKAGISFEYVDFLASTGINNSNTNSGGWKNTELRGTLNGATYSLLIKKYNIKKVKKDYIPTYNVASTQQTEDYLWLLSCGEIWDNGYNGGKGKAITTEGKQYKYYKMNLGSTSYSSLNNITKKPSTNNSTWWWLRSPDCSYGSHFCNVSSVGYCNSDNASDSVAVAPGFSI